MTRTLYGADDTAVHFAKRIAGANPFVQREVAADCGLSLQDYEDALSKPAESIRKPGESKQRAFVGYRTTTVGGNRRAT